MTALEGTGIRCWIADRDIEAATSYPAAITAAIKGCGALLLLLTEAANASPHVLREVELAFNARRPIFPVRIAHVTPSSDLQYFLSTSQWLDTGASFDDEDLARVEPVLKEVLERGKSESPGGGGSAESRRWLWIAGAAAVVILAGVMLWSRGGAQPPSATLSSAATPNPVTTPTAAERPPTRAPESTGIPEKVNPRDGQAYAWIAPGRFVMGCSDGDTACESDEKPVHPVAITRGFWLSRTEVTNAQYHKLMSTGRDTPAAASSSDMPVTQVDWSQAKAYCARVGGRLPTEAEWEYAARGGTRTRYYDTLQAVAWFADNSDDHPHPVGMKTPNAFGLHDMLGNVSEWVLDRYYNAYDDTSDPATPDQPLAGNASGVARGGSWVSDAGGVRVSRRLEVPPDAEEPHIGFRCAVDRL